MHDFKFRRGELYCESVPVRRIADTVGTPVYIYSAHTILDHFLKLQRAFRTVKPLICFSVKANSNLAVLRLLQRAGAGFDVVSGGELYRVLAIGADPARIVYASVGKSDAEIAQALRAGILCFNVESTPELAAIEAVCRRLGRTARVCLRLNPGIDPKTHRFIATGTSGSKFGLDPETAEQLIVESDRYPHLVFAGLHLHIGSQITEARPFVQAVRIAARIVGRLRRRRVRLRWLNIGGGLGIVYRQDERPQSAQRFARAILPVIKPLGLELLLEPGRFIVGNGGLLATKVLFFKQTSRKRFLIVDAGMNDLIRPSLYDAYHEIAPVVTDSRLWNPTGRPGARVEGSQVRPTDVVGPVCESGDFLARERRLPAVRPGELLGVFGAGAYGFVMSSNYNSRPRPAEVLVIGKRFFVVRHRERYQDLVRGERIPEVLTS